ncbi:DUF6787 family protein [Gracilimonas tropica]|uniref:DUF6787 family protein n=1 Tax=Gracilimonas tropica TaxID=454600 RepID=UPI0003686BFC
MKYFEKLKSKWEIDSNWQVLVILLVFSVAGMSVVFVRKFVFSVLGITESDPLWLKTLIWLFTIPPTYHVLLLIYGTLFGQFQFFWGFFKKTLRRLVPSS